MNNNPKAEYGFISSEERLAEEKAYRERGEKLRSMSDAELLAEEKIGGITGVIARFEIKRRSKWGRFTYAFGVVFLLGWGILSVGLFVLELWNVYLTQGL